MKVLTLSHSLVNSTELATISAGACYVPSIEHGKYSLFAESSQASQQNHDPKNQSLALVAMDTVANGQTIVFQCDAGFNIQGPNLSTCHDGNFSNTLLPECLPGPCVLPEILHAVYQGGYRSGLTIAHGSHVMVQCDNGNSNGNSIPPVQMDCALGALTPSSISCSFSQKKARDDSEGTSLIIDDGNSTNSLEEDECGPPSKELLMLFYQAERSEELIESDETFPSGTEILFNCIASITGDRATWKIVCENGNWIGRAHDCSEFEMHRCRFFSFLMTSAYSNLHSQSTTRDSTARHMPTAHASTRIPTSMSQVSTTIRR